MRSPEWISVRFVSQMIGQTLAHYKILEKIGSGGMGDVYLAEDTKLDRRVALKVLPPELADNVDRRSRFAREAKAVATLNHPNIVTLHSVEEAGGVHFITMELVKGKTLAEILPKKKASASDRSSRSRYPSPMRSQRHTSEGSLTGM